MELEQFDRGLLGEEVLPEFFWTVLTPFGVPYPSRAFLIMSNAFDHILRTAQVDRLAGQVDVDGVQFNIRTNDHLQTLGMLCSLHYKLLVRPMDVCPI